MNSSEWEKSSSSTVVPAEDPEKEKTLSRKTRAARLVQQQALHPSFLSRNLTSAFTQAGTYERPLKKSTTAKVVEGQLTAAMLLATPKNVNAKVQKENLFVGIKVFNMMEINASLMFFRCRLKILTNWRIHADSQNKEFMTLLSVAKEQVGFIDEPLLVRIGSKSAVAVYTFSLYVYILLNVPLPSFRRVPGFYHKVVFVPKELVESFPQGEWTQSLPG
jgi:hypothetical protein